MATARPLVLTSLAGRATSNGQVGQIVLESLIGVKSDARLWGIHPTSVNPFFPQSFPQVTNSPLPRNAGATFFLRPRVRSPMSHRWTLVRHSSPKKIMRHPENWTDSSQEGYGLFQPLRPPPPVVHPAPMSSQELPQVVV